MTLAREAGVREAAIAAVAHRLPLDELTDDERLVIRYGVSSSSTSASPTGPSPLSGTGDEVECVAHPKAGEVVVQPRGGVRDQTERGRGHGTRRLQSVRVHDPATGRPCRD